MAFKRIKLNKLKKTKKQITQNINNEKKLKQTSNSDEEKKNLSSSIEEGESKLSHIKKEILKKKKSISKSRKNKFIMFFSLFGVPGLLIMTFLTLTMIIIFAATMGGMISTISGLANPEQRAILKAQNLLGDEKVVNIPDSLIGSEPDLSASDSTSKSSKSSSKSKSSSSDLVSGDMETNAKSLAKAMSGNRSLKAWQIASVLGNWQTESSIDPTAVETIFDEKYKIGDKKKKAAQADFSISAIDASYAARFPSIKYAGIGLGQWTNERTKTLLAYAKSKNKNWYDLGLQEDFWWNESSYYQNIIKNIPNDESGAMYYLVKWEGINNGTGATRTAQAKAWHDKVTGWIK